MHGPVRFVSFVGLMVSLWLPLACAQGPPPAEHPDEFRVGLLATLSGAVAETAGKSTVEGAQLAVKAANDAGGISAGGRQQHVSLVVEDDQDRAEAAVDAARKLISQEGVAVVVGPQFSRNAIPVAAVAENARVPMISPASTQPETTAGKRYVFRAAFTDPFQGRVLAVFARDELHAQRVAVLYDVASAYNKGLAEIFRDAFQAGGGQVVAFESYTTDVKSSVASQLERVRTSTPQVLFLPNYADEVPAQVEQARQLGIGSALLGSDSWGDIEATDLQKLEGAFYTGHWAPDMGSAQAQAFVAAYRQAYGRPPTETAALTYDALGLLFQAVARQGALDPESVRNALASVDSYTGVTGTMRFQGTGDPVRSIVMLQIHGGRPTFYKLVDPQGSGG
jgi:branched-chain amino acid transport system substrate-binding protein